MLFKDRRIRVVDGTSLETLLSVFGMLGLLGCKIDVLPMERMFSFLGGTSITADSQYPMPSSEKRSVMGEDTPCYTLKAVGIYTICGVLQRR
jgi:hypothetical protein